MKNDAMVLVKEPISQEDEEPNAISILAMQAIIDKLMEMIESDEKEDIKVEQVLPTEPLSLWKRIKTTFTKGN